MNVEAKNILSRKALEAYNIEENLVCEFEEVDPKLLLNVKRIDVIAKILYLQLKNKCAKLADDLYYESLKVVTNGTFFEPGNKDKRNFEDYKKTFEITENNILSSGFDREYAIPIDCEGVILDGAHRLAIAYVNNISVPVIKIPIKTNTDYGIEKFVKKNCDEDIVNILINETIKLIPDIYIANIWPAAIGHDAEIEDIFIKKDIEILYKTSINLTANGAFSYIYQIYRDEPWSGDILNGFSGTNRKVTPCFPNDLPLRVWLIKSKSLDHVIEAKAEIRKVFDVGNHSLHINDYQREALLMAKLLFNRNSIYFMNYANPTKYKEFTNSLKLFCEKNNAITITGSGVMSLYGLCKGNDIDYFCSEDDEVLIGKSHNAYLKLYQLSLGDVLYDERMYADYLGMHIINLDVIKQFKERRGEKKDIIDVDLINSFEKKTNGEISKREERKMKIKKTYREITTKCQIFIIKLSHKTGTYMLLRKIYHKLIDSK